MSESTFNKSQNKINNSANPTRLDNLGECITNICEYNATSILGAEYLLHYLQSRFVAQTKHINIDSLKELLVGKYGSKIIGTYGYNVCLSGMEREDFIFMQRAWKESECNEKINDNANHCLAVKRVIAAFRYYDNFDTFYKFITEKYKFWLDDIIHIKQHHLNKMRLQCKYDAMECELRKCVTELFEYDATSILSAEHLLFYINSQNVFSFARQIKQKEVCELLVKTFGDRIIGKYGYNLCVLSEYQDIDKRKCIKQEFNNIHFLLCHKDEFVRRDSIRGQKTTDGRPLKNKFVIDNSRNARDFTSDLTYLDAVYSELESANAKHLDSVIRDNEYDTESFVDDINSAHPNIDLLLEIDNIKLSLIKRTVCDAETESNSFNKGMNFHYWGRGHYKDNECVGVFVQQKYKSFKEEILNYNEMSMNIFSTIILPKVEQYILSKKAKSMKPLFNIDYYNYGIEAGAPLKMEHLMAIVLYTDLSELSADFSATFRRKGYETIQHIIRKNSEYYFMSKNLREIVTYYGLDYDSSDGTITGPFYCGMSCVMGMPRVCINLYAPTSTSIQFSVAQRFCGNNGMILEFDNNAVFGGSDVKLLDVSWISTFSEEEELIIFGGKQHIRIESIRIILTEKKYTSYHELCHGLYWIQSLIDGAVHLKNEIDWSDGDEIVYKSLLNFACGNFDDIDAFTKQQFEAFIVHTKQIIIDLPFLAGQLHYGNCPQMQNIMVTKLRKDNYKKGNIVWKSGETGDGGINLPNFKTMKIFRKVKNITINTTNRGKSGNVRYTSYSLVLNELIENIKMHIHRSQKITYKIIATRKNLLGSWISDLAASAKHIDGAVNIQQNVNGKDIITFKI